LRERVPGCEEVQMKGETPISPELNTTDFRQKMEQSLQKTEARHWWWLWLLVLVLLSGH
jgi:hypothetical protein